jgi:hypothetical protein
LRTVHLNGHMQSFYKCTNFMQTIDKITEGIQGKGF